MKAYITSIGETTTELCEWQLKRLGYKTILLNQVEPWIVKYKRFIEMANEDCLRVDADILVNNSIPKGIDKDSLMIQFHVFDIYKNKISICSPIFYRKKGIEIIRKNLDNLYVSRPEASAWRIEEINPYTKTSPIIAGIHGLLQNKETIDRAIENKKQRGQFDDYDFELAKKINEICVCKRLY